MQCTECGHEMTPKGTTKKRREGSVVSIVSSLVSIVILFFPQPTVIGGLPISPLTVVPPIGSEPVSTLAIRGQELPPPGYRVRYYTMRQYPPLSILRPVMHAALSNPQLGRSVPTVVPQSSPNL